MFEELVLKSSNEIFVYFSLFQLLKIFLAIFSVVRIMSLLKIESVVVLHTIFSLTWALIWF